MSLDTEGVRDLEGPTRGHRLGGSRQLAEGLEVARPGEGSSPGRRPSWHHGTARLVGSVGWGTRRALPAGPRACCRGLYGGSSGACSGWMGRFVNVWRSSWDSE